MADREWVVLLEHLMPAGWVPIDPAEQEMLFVESELQAKGIDVVFDPRRPGDNYSSRSAGLVIKLMVPASDHERAQEILRDLEESEQ